MRLDRPSDDGGVPQDREAVYGPAPDHGLGGRGRRHVETVSYTENTDTYNTLTLGLESGVGYNLRMSKVGVGRIDERQEAHYIVLEGKDRRNVINETTENIDVKIRDRYNNPVSGVDVSFDDSELGEGTLTEIQDTTNVKGIASFRYEAPAVPDSGVVEFSIGSGTEEYERVNVSINVIALGGQGSQQDVPPEDDRGGGDGPPGRGPPGDDEDGPGQGRGPPGQGNGPGQGAGQGQGRGR